MKIHIFLSLYECGFNNDKKINKMGVLGENIKHLRKAKQLSQCELADKVGLKRGNIASYEKNAAEPKITNIIKLADFFNISVCDFVKKNLSAEMEIAPTFEDITEKPVLITSELERIQKECQEFDNMISGMKCYHSFRANQIKEHTEDTKMLSSEVERLLSVIESLMRSHKYLINVIENHTSCEEE